MNISTLTRYGERDSHGQLRVNFADAISAAYPEIRLRYSKPGYFGHSGNLELHNDEDGWMLYLPEGRYSSAKHFHTAGHGILAVESSRKKLNLAGCPLYLLVGYAYNADYGSLKKTYWFFGKNEDGSFFLHKIRPNIAQTQNFDQIRSWMWQLKGKEVLAARQGDLGFIKKERMAGTLKVVDPGVIHLGNHAVNADVIKTTAHRTYVLNPRATHGEHDPQVLEGIYELRLARQWELGYGD